MKTSRSLARFGVAVEAKLKCCGKIHGKLMGQAISMHNNLCIWFQG